MPKLKKNSLEFDEHFVGTQKSALQNWSWNLLIVEHKKNEQNVHTRWNCSRKFFIHWNMVLGGNINDMSECAQTPTIATFFAALLHFDIKFYVMIILLSDYSELFIIKESWGGK